MYVGTVVQQISICNNSVDEARQKLEPCYFVIFFMHFYCSPITSIISYESICMRVYMLPMITSDRVLRKGNQISLCMHGAQALLNSASNQVAICLLEYTTGQL